MSELTGAHAARQSLATAAVLGALLVFTISPALAGPVDFSKLKAFEQMKDFLAKAKQIEDLSEKSDSAGKSLDDFDKLDPSDDDYDPNYNPPGAPGLPLMCKDSSECTHCFTQPHKELNHLRFRFEKLRKINRVTKKMLRDNIAWGDAAAGVAGGLTPLAWESEKRKIRQSEKNFNASYDAKYDELTASLLNVLQQIAACEETVFGEQGWYERYGFMYYQFMADAYRRPD